MNENDKPDSKSMHVKNNTLGRTARTRTVTNEKTRRIKAMIRRSREGIG